MEWPAHPPLGGGGSVEFFLETLCQSVAVGD